MIVDPSTKSLAPMLFIEHMANMGVLSSFDALESWEHYFYDFYFDT